MAVQHPAVLTIWSISSVVMPGRMAAAARSSTYGTGQAGRRAGTSDAAMPTTAAGGSGRGGGGGRGL